MFHVRSSFIYVVWMQCTPFTFFPLYKKRETHGRQPSSNMEEMLNVKKMQKGGEETEHFSLIKGGVEWDLHYQLGERANGY